MVVRLKSASRNDWSGLLQMLGNVPKVSNKEKKEIKVISKENEGKEGKRK